MQPVDFRFLALAIAALATLVSLALAQDLTFDVHAGASVHAPNTIHVLQAGHAPTSITGATYTTRPFSHLDSLIGLTENYYSLRVGYFPRAAQPGVWNYGVEVEFLHDKAYYESGDDPGGVVQHFELSDGLNQLLVNLAARYPLLEDEEFPSGRLHLIARAGVGPAITAPASVVRGLESGTRSHMAPDVFYTMAGPSAQVAAQARYYLAPWAALSLEAKATVARTRNPIADGSATATFNGAHVNFGVTFQVP